MHRRASGSSYLAGRDELKRPEGGLHVRDVRLQLVESSGDAGLNLIGLGPRGGVGGDLVKGLSRHFGGYRGSSGSSRVSTRARGSIYYRSVRREFALWVAERLALA